MARKVFPDDRAVQRIPTSSGLPITSYGANTLTVYTDAAGTALADIQTYPGGAAIAGSIIACDTQGKMPLFYGPDGVDDLYVTPTGGTPQPVYARVDDRADSLEAATTTAALTAQLNGTFVTQALGALGTDVGVVARLYAATSAQQMALFNGASKPLSGYYGSVAAAQVAYPHATALTNELDWAIVQAALNAAKASGVVVELPSGTGITDQPLVCSTSAASAPSPALRGRGRYATVIDYRGAGLYAIDFESTVAYAFQQAPLFENFSVVSNGGSGTRGGIYVKGLWQVWLRNVRVDGMTGHGLTIDSPTGDADASINVTLDSCRLWNNTLYGLNAVCGTNTANISYLTLRSCSIQGNLGAGIYWTGAVCSIKDTGIATNKGLGGLYLGYSGSSNMNLAMDSVTFENNSPRHIHVTSLICGVWDNMDFRHSSQVAYPATDAIKLVPAAAAQVNQIVMTAPNIFALPAYTPYTFLALDGTSGPVTGVRLVNPKWRNFDSAGQVRVATTNVANVKDISRIPPRTEAANALALVNGDNADLAIGLDAERFVLNGPAGACAITGIANGWEGRRVTFLWTNGSGVVLTLKSDNAGSAVANRLMMPGGADKALPAFTRVCIEFEWTAALGSGGWWMRTVQTA